MKTNKAIAVVCVNGLEYEMYTKYMNQKLICLLDSMFTPEQKNEVIYKLINDGIISKNKLK